ncbi:hypothetical protein TNIN_219341 [Trichonephila inaurata madagascariensis]|uniref:Uncharacterized protein n=1 Tax=Trichonephila inaurata madagascariensis TaxID=2747483 RepID=A0A8X6YM83_9ARAC|nr:hypothetical protein TNIN_219341 [Trichonephila inaurata madagascariensis]
MKDDGKKQCKKIKILGDIPVAVDGTGEEDIPPEWCLIFDNLSIPSPFKRSQNQKSKALNILKVLANTAGSRPTSLFRFYRALIRSKLGYGVCGLQFCGKSLLKILDPVHHQALRLCLGAFLRQNESLYAEAYLTPIRFGGSIYV